MKKILPLILLCAFEFCLGQEKPQVQFVSTTNVIGTCNFNSIVYVEYKKSSDGTTSISDTITVTNGNNFALKFTEPQKAGNKCTVWATHKNKLNITVPSEKQEYIVLDDVSIVNLLTKNAKDNYNDYENEVATINEFNAKKDALKNTTLTYATSIWSTNFNIPLIRFNLIEGDDTKKGDVLIFSSIGAGIGHSWGHLERTRDNRGEIVNEEFSSTFGIHLGALFSAGTGEDNKNVFAPTFNLSLLDFQIGLGYELGTILPSQKREFLTLSYGIPLYKLFKRSYRLRRSTDTPISSTIKTQN